MEGGVLMICGTLGSRTARDGLTAQSVGVPCKRVPNPCGQQSRSGVHLSAGGGMECLVEVRYWEFGLGRAAYGNLMWGTFIVEKGRAAPASRHGVSTEEKMTK